MNRLGLVDFWCYNNEEFDFENGHMSLRGSNGSGKSVTMQSFIPLLLDGNKSSERLDPFGTRSRRMETYLIDENSTRNERIGYLYLEFKREDSEIYKTIGMGLHAKKSQPLKSWYFVIEDNRRVNIDFQLMENQLTLKEKQLRNILGDQVISSQKEYMKRVNDALFGFESLEEYSDAISLLLQLRSPKLSNSLSPNKINDILAKSLQPLSDEDLRPMSEAIINMDNLQDQLEDLKQSQEAASKLEQAYATYNKALLVEKWNKYVKHHQEYRQIEERLKQKNKEKTDKQNEKLESQNQLKDNQIEYQVKKDEYESLKNSDIEQWVENIRQIDINLSEYQNELNKKNQTYEQKDQLYQTTNQTLEKHQNTIDQKEMELKKLIQEMDFLNEALSLSEHIAVKKCYEDKEKDYNFSYTRSEIKKEIDKVKDGLKKWQAYDEKNQQVIFFENQESESQNQLIAMQDQLTNAQEHYQQTIEEYHEFFYRYSSQNQVLHLSQDDLKQIRECLIDYENSRDYTCIFNFVTKSYQQFNQQFEKEKLLLTHQLNELDNQHASLIQQRDEWVNMDDPEPEMSEENKRNRQYLKDHHIPYISLYKLLDFAESVSDEEKNRIEELLLEMNLLDALVISNQYKDVLKDMPAGCQDYYLWTSQSVESLQTIMISSLQQQDDLQKILTSLGIENASFVQIEEKYFRSGVIEGSLSLNKEAVYIGYERRLKLKNDMIAQFNQQIQEVENEIHIRESQLEECENHIKQLTQEYQQCISETALKEAMNQVDSLLRECEFLEKQIQDIHQHYLKEFTQQQAIYNELQVIASQMQLPVKKETFESYQDDLENYQQYFQSFADAYTAYMQTMTLRDLAYEKKEEYQNDIDELNYEIDQLTQKITISIQKKENLQKQLDEAGYTDIAKRIEDIQLRLAEIEKDNRQLEKKIYTLEADEKHLENEILEQIQSQNHQAEITKIYQDIYEQEYNLHFVFQDDSQDVSALRTLAQEMSQKKTIADYQTQLQRIFFEQSQYLSQYNVVQENYDLCHDVEDISSRLILKAIHLGKKISFPDLLDVLSQNIEMQELLIVDEDRRIFEEILVNTIGKKIRDRIQESRRWVEKIQSYMHDMNTSSGLQLSIKWKSRKSIDDQELDTQQLVELLEKDYHVLKESDRLKISNHFRNKIQTARKMSLDENTTASFHQLMREVMDYRQWFDFTLYAKKPNENRKELTSHVFFAYSGGEKALSMYVPLFSAVAAKFESAREDAPLLIALDEAFAGVDENNIDNMFALITKFGFDYIMNSQVLWGDYPSCPSLAIYELFRPNNAPYVTVIAYIWNGFKKRARFS